MKIASRTPRAAPGNVRTRFVVCIALVLAGLAWDAVAGGASLGNLLVIGGVIGALVAAFDWARAKDKSERAGHG
jgi:membrane associated rhomboid family serine protease